MRPDVPPHGAQSAPWGPRQSGATSAERGPHRACCARWGAIPGVFERGATQPAPGPATRQPCWGGGGMQRRPNAAGVSPRAARLRAARFRLGAFTFMIKTSSLRRTLIGFVSSPGAKRRIARDERLTPHDFVWPKAGSPKPKAMSAQLQRREAEQREDDRHDDEPRDDLRLAPANQLEVMMERRHAEQALPTRRLEIPDLQDHRKRLEHEHAADNRQQQLLLDQNGHRAEGGAKRQRSDVAHETRGGARVVPEEPE